MDVAQESIEIVAQEIKRLTESLLLKSADAQALPRTGRVLNTITEVNQQLSEVMNRLDPIKQPDFVFNPADPSVLGRIVGIAMISQKRIPLSQLEKFYGAGVYALYYIGDHQAYSLLSGKEHPIYVGKADPADPASQSATQQGDRLARRLGEHRKNISRATTTLRLEDFEYRALVVQTGWQTAAENYLIDLFKPIWNSEMNICYGFGKHGDDPKTRSNKRSPWDTLHPGRSWAHSDAEMKDAKSESDIHSAINAHLSALPPFSTKEEILERFLDEIKAQA